MSNIILQEWRFTATSVGVSPVIPDGCRDLIYLASPGKQPCWFVTSLDHCVRRVAVGSGDFFRGYRLQPGAHVDIARLLESVRNLEPEQGEVVSRIESFSSLRSEVAEALACIGSGRANIKMKARELGVSVRTLQRLVRGATRMPPLFWSRLARVRKSARAAVHPVCLAQTACKFGFADQAHMSREFRHWLNISPSGLRSDRHVPGQLEHKGYC